MKDHWAREAIVNLRNEISHKYISGNLFDPITNTFSTCYSLGFKERISELETKLSAIQDYLNIEWQEEKKEPAKFVKKNKNGKL